MSKITLNDVGSLIDVTSAQTTINNNSDVITTAFENTLSRDGTSPNKMESPLDMDSNPIINLPLPVSMNSPLRLADAATLNGGGTITGLPAGGTTGAPLVKTSNSDYNVDWDTITGTGSTVKQTSPTLITPNLGTPSAGVLTNVTGLPVTTGISGLGTGVATFLATPSSANLAAAVTNETGSGSLVFSDNATLNGATLNSPIFSTSSFNNANLTGTVTGSASYTTPTLTGPTLSGTVNVSGLTASSAVATDGSKNLVSVTNTGTGNNVLATSPSITTATLTTPNITGVTNASNATAGSVGEYISLATPNADNAGTITVTIASPAVVTWTSNPFFGGTTATAWTVPVIFTTTGALPTGITAGTTYWVIGATCTANTFQIATSAANGIAGTAINTSGSQSGTHTGTSGVGLTSGSGFNVCALSVPAGDWDLFGTGGFLPAAGTSITQSLAGWSLNSATFGSAGTFSANVNAAFVPGHTQYHVVFPNNRLSLNATTTVYLVASSTFTVSTNTAFGFIGFRRAR